MVLGICWSNQPQVSTHVLWNDVGFRSLVIHDPVALSHNRWGNHRKMQRAQVTRWTRVWTRVLANFSHLKSMASCILVDVYIDRRTFGECGGTIIRNKQELICIVI